MPKLEDIATGLAEERFPDLGGKNAVRQLRASRRAFVEGFMVIGSALTKCRICGCTEVTACDTPAGPCRWVESDLCSAPACLEKASS